MCDLELFFQNPVTYYIVIYVTRLLSSYVIAQDAV